MSHTIVYDSELHIIEIRIQGKLTLQEAKEITSETAQIAVEKNCFLSLNDSREAIINLSTVEIYQLPAIISDIADSTGLDAHNIKRALVVAKNLRDFHFYETVNINQAQNMKLFQDIDEAKKWLLEK